MTDKDSTTETKTKDLVYPLLQTGEENATPAADLCRILNCTRQELSAVIEAERRRGLPICANQHGYYKPKNQREMTKFVSSMYHRSREIRKTGRACKNTIDGLPRE